MDWNQIKLMILDVDGVLTDGSITMDADGEMIKSFHVHDGYAIKLWQQSGGKAAILTCRQHPAIRRRASELDIEQVYCGVSDKVIGYEQILSATGLQDASVCYIGDDFPDLQPLKRSGFSVAVGNAVPAVKRRAWYVTRHHGGAGAVAEVVEFLLRKQRRWSRSIRGKV